MEQEKLQNQLSPQIEEDKAVHSTIKILEQTRNYIDGALAHLKQLAGNNKN